MAIQFLEAAVGFPLNILRAGEDQWSPVEIWRLKDKSHTLKDKRASIWLFLHSEEHRAEKLE
jgi:hypothetical protein